MESNFSTFIQEFRQSYDNGTFKKLLLSIPIAKGDSINKVQVRLVEIKNEKKFTFVFEYSTKHITKNFSIEESESQLNSLIQTQFKNAILYTSKNDIRLSFSKKMKSKLNYGCATCSISVSTNHNKEKNRLINIEDNQYLKELGVVNKNNQLSQNKQSKFKQINKYIETVDSVLKLSNLKNEKSIRIVDMGSGKGYLTFAIYDYLVNTLKIDAQITGVELREELVNLCNDIAKKCNFNNLQFHKGDIKSYESNNADILIALHACDTATDDAIYQGIISDSSIIITAPCCHKQVRRELNVTNTLKDIVRHGILKERQAEILTDTMRGLVLEAYGYKTQIFEFIADEHTHKNVMIVGTKHNNQKDKAVFFEKINDLKKMFGVNKFYLEDLFKEKYELEYTNTKK